MIKYFFLSLTVISVLICYYHFYLFLKNRLKLPFEQGKWKLSSIEKKKSSLSGADKNLLSYVAKCKKRSNTFGAISIVLCFITVIYALLIG